MRISTSTIGLMVGFVICWSSGFIGSRLASDAPMAALDLFAWRFLLATAIALAWCLACRVRGVSLYAVGLEMGVGALTMGGYLLGVMLAVDAGVSTGATALITAQQPLLAAAIATLWLRERLGTLGWAGLAVAAGGVALCVVGDWRSAGGASAWSYALPLLSVVSVTLGSVLASRYPSGLGMAPSLTSQLAAASVVFLAAAGVSGDLTWPTGMTLADTKTLGWLVVLSSFGGYGFFTACLRRVGLTTVSSAIFLTPPVTLLWAMWMFGEPVAMLQIGGIALALLGVAASLLARNPETRHQIQEAVTP
ncbi:DMT family transporter [Salinicola halophilus]|uniref:DMT family transporter n=1 Tax=Salinicola halophilus TaxID=184065 RepID=UPI000DA18A7F|nr:DMT family transporter [Salinicola halophilus]